MKEKKSQTAFTPSVHTPNTAGCRAASPLIAESTELFKSSAPKQRVARLHLCESVRSVRVLALEFRVEAAVKAAEEEQGTEEAQRKTTQLPPPSLLLNFTVAATFLRLTPD